MISYEEALDIALAAVQQDIPEETVPLVLSLGRVLSKPIVASENIPARANSAMDGYAVLAEDVTQATVETPAKLQVIGESAAGSMFEGTVGRGQAVRIMTGGIVPDGANAVIEVESTSEADGIVDVRRAVSLGTSVREAGEDIRAGEEIIPQGKRLRSGDIGVLASLGVTNVPVRVKPKVGIIATGNEIVDPVVTPKPGQIRNSSTPALYAACTEAGAEPVDLGIAGDDREELEEKLEIGLRYDILLTTGGVSAGEYDLVQHVLPEMGVDVLFHKVRIKPGKPVLFGTRADDGKQTLVFGLPGNPVSSLVVFRQFVVPVIHGLLGQQNPRVRVPARLATTIKKDDNKRHFVRGVLHTSPDGTLLVDRTGTQSSGALSSMSIANCLIIIEESAQELPAGTTVMVELL